MIDTQTIKNKIGRIQYDLTQLTRFSNVSFDDVAQNYDTHKIVERIIEVIVNEAIDINQHIIVESGKGQLPFDFKESFLLLTNLKVYPKDFADKISRSVGLRNILVHEYGKLDEHIFYTSINDCLTQYTAYCRYILDYLSSKNT